MKKNFDFSGYATKNNLKCSDGRTILENAFKNNDGQTVPLVWQHMHNDPSNVLGHALLENRKDGVYAYCKFNNGVKGQQAKTLVEHGDVVALSIYANQLQESNGRVSHGAIREVSLVLAGANPGAKIDNIAFAHSDGSTDIADDEAIIKFVDEKGLDIQHSDEEEIEEDEIQHADEDDETVEEVFNSMSEKQKTVVYALVGQALEDAQNGGDKMKHNVFEQKDNEMTGAVLTHSQLQTILADAQKVGSLKEAVLMHATEYGIEDIDVLFPDAKALSKDPEWLKREDDWVAGVLAAIHHSPFSRIKTVTADMDFETARAKGYVKATEKKEVYFKMAKRVTTPTTVYVKQKIDRDDLIDVTDFDVVAMIRFQLRTLLNEELAQAALIGDGREPEDEYKINEENIRPIWTDEDLYTVKEKLTSKTDYKKIIKEIAFSGKRYKGSGAPVLYTTNEHHVNMLWVEDTNGRRIYESDATLCAALGVSKIVEVPHFVGKQRSDKDGNKFDLFGIKVNLKDYNFGADKGGQVATFDDFDIDYNQYKYLMETRCSGALTKVHSAQVFEFPVVEPAKTE